MRLVFLAGLSLLLAACSGSSPPPADAGKPDAGNAARSLGLTVGTCYELSSTDSAQSPPALGVAVEGTNPNGIRYLPDGGSAKVTALKLVYRQTGNPRMTDTLYADGPDLLLLRRDVANAEQVTYHPALVLAHLPLKNAYHLDQTGQFRGFGGGFDGGMVPYQLGLDVFEQTLQVPAGDGGVDAYTINFSQGPGSQAPGRLASWSFSPKNGLVEMAVAFAGDDGGVPVYKLQAKHTLAAGQICGSL